MVAPRRVDSTQCALAGGFGAWRRSGRAIERAGTLSAKELAEQRKRFQILDVREIDEYDQGHIPGAKHCFVGHLTERVKELYLDPEGPVVVTCGVGHRAGVGVAILQRAGFTDVGNLLGGMSAWNALDLPVEK